MRYELRKKEKELRRQRKQLERELQREAVELAEGIFSDRIILLLCLTSLLRITARLYVVAECLQYLGKYERFFIE